MTNPLVQVWHMADGDLTYDALAFICPGCALDGQTGLHLLPITPAGPRPVWGFDGNLEAPTLHPSILTRMDHRRAKSDDGEWVDVGPFVCHAFMRAGSMEFLTDCTHALAGQTVPVPSLPDFVVRESGRRRGDE